MAPHLYYPLSCPNEGCPFVMENHEARKNHFLACSAKTIRRHLQVLADKEALEAEWQEERLVKIKELDADALEAAASEAVAAASKARAAATVARSKV